MNDQTRVVVSTEQVSCNLDGDVVILSLSNGTYYELNPVAARVWEILQSPTAFADLRQAVEAEYDVVPERAQRDLTALLADLKKHGLLTEHEGPDAASRTA
jgi:hypothetical protein